MVKVKSTVRPQDVELQEGKDINVADGHLFVYDARVPNGDVIAAFARTRGST